MIVQTSMSRCIQGCSHVFDILGTQSFQNHFKTFLSQILGGGGKPYFYHSLSQLLGGPGPPAHSKTTPLCIAESPFLQCQFSALQGYRAWAEKIFLTSEPAVFPYMYIHYNFFSITSTPILIFTVKIIA